MIQFAKHNIHDLLYDSDEIVTEIDWYNFGYVYDYKELIEPTKSIFEKPLRTKKSFWRFIK